MGPNGDDNNIGDDPALPLYSYAEVSLQTLGTSNTKGIAYANAQGYDEVILLVLDNYTAPIRSLQVSATASIQNITIQSNTAYLQKLYTNTTIFIGRQVCRMTT